MIGLPKRLRASLRCDAINGDSFERSVCAKQMREAADSLERADARIAELEQSVTDRNAKLAQLQGELDLARIGAATVLAERDEAVSILAEWCSAIQRNGADWDDWDEHYKDAAYRPTQTNLRALIDAARAGNGG